MGEVSKPTCQGTKADGNPCTSTIIQKNGYCYAHDPDGDEDRMRRLAQKSVEVKQQRANKKGFDFTELKPLKTYEDAKDRLDLISRAVMSDRLGDKAAQASIRAVAEWVKTESEAATAYVVDELTKEINRLKKQVGAA